MCLIQLIFQGVPSTAQLDTGFVISPSHDDPAVIQTNTKHDTYKR